MNNDEYNDKYNDNFNKEESKIKTKMYILMTFSVVGTIILLIIMGVCFVKSFFSDMSKHGYYVLQITNQNKNELISLLQQEQQNYCESVYKIEYSHDSAITIYCKDEKNIIIYKAYKITDYIKANGKFERR